MSRLIYAGIGSRRTPSSVLNQMYLIAQQLAPNWLLRSGHAGGADKAFELGAIAQKGPMEIFVPWYRFNGAPEGDARYIRPKATPELAEFAAKYHPNWDACSDAAKLMHMRNCCQILGEDGESPATMVICYTPKASGSGGTGQAIRIANDFNIPVFDLGNPFTPKVLCDFVAGLEVSR